MNDWTQFTQKVYVQASVKEVYDMWTVPAQLERWFLRNASFADQFGRLRGIKESVEAGDTYRWMWHGHPDTTAEQGIVTVANGTDTFEFVFGKAGTVKVVLKPNGELTEIMLTQSGIPDDDVNRMNYYVGCSTGWTFYFANIKALLEYGVDLRNKDMDLKNVINA